VDYDAALKVLRDPETALTVVPVITEIADDLKQVARAHVPDMPDRIIAATARYLGLPPVTCDRKIQTSGIATIW
jgi:predicted nucleic acid-binding protein